MVSATGPQEAPGHPWKSGRKMRYQINLHPQARISGAHQPSTLSKVQCKKSQWRRKIQINGPELFIVLKLKFNPFNQKRMKEFEPSSNSHELKPLRRRRSELEINHMGVTMNG